MGMRMKSWVLLVAAAAIVSCTCRSQVPQQDETATTRVEERQAEAGKAPEPEAGQSAGVEGASAAEQAGPVEQQPAPQAEPAAPGPEVAEPPAAEAPVAEETPRPGPEEPPVEAPGHESPETAAQPQPEESFVVTEEVYTKTFDEVEEFVRTLNDIIRRRDYSTWLTYLTEEYIRQKSDPEYLREQSEMPLLKKNNVELRSLQDYFRYVVVPSRSQATIDDIEFIDEDHVKAISTIRGTRGILYLLERKNGGWKIGVWE
jgi:hypothetical protein